MYFRIYKILIFSFCALIYVSNSSSIHVENRERSSGVTFLQGRNARMNTSTPLPPFFTYKPRPLIRLLLSFHKRKKFYSNSLRSTEINYISFVIPSIISPKSPIKTLISKNNLLFFACRRSLLQKITPLQIPSQTISNHLIPSANFRSLHTWQAACH